MAKTRAISHFKVDTGTKELKNTNIKTVENKNSKNIGNMARNAAQSTYSNVQDNVQSGLGNVQNALIAGLAMAQGLLRKNRKKYNQPLQDTVNNLQSTAQSGLQQTQAALQTGLTVAQVAAVKGVAKANKNLKKAQKNLRKAQYAAQDTAHTAKDKALDALETGRRQANENILQATTSARDVRDMLLEQRAQRRRQRKWARRMFRLGIVTGLILILLYTPISGLEIRRRIAALWQQYVSPRPSTANSTTRPGQGVRVNS